MFYLMSKLLPLFVYPLGLSCFLLLTALLLRKHPRWQSGVILGALALLWLGGNQIVAMALTRSLEWRHLPPPEMPNGDVIVVLGGTTRAQSFPRATHEINEAGDRLFYAAHLYHQGAAPRILLSGGAAPLIDSSRRPEAYAMADVMALVGVPQEALILETGSRNTFENAQATFEILRQENVERIILVTSAVHMPRAVMIFEKYDWEVIPAPTDFYLSQEDWNYYTRLDLAIQLRNLLPQAGNLSRTTSALKEYIGILAYRVSGRL